MGNNLLADFSYTVHEKFSGKGNYHCMSCHGGGIQETAHWRGTEGELPGPEVVLKETVERAVIPCPRCFPDQHAFYQALLRQGFALNERVLRQLAAVEKELDRLRRKMAQYG